VTLARRAVPVAAVVAIMAASCTPAAALVARGHVFAGTLEGSGETALVDPTGVAVDEANGEVFVVDRAAPHERVERFKPDGNGGYEFVSSFAVKSPEEIAVDNSGGESQGDVYVVGAEEEDVEPEEHDVLYKYDPQTGKMVYKRTVFHAAKEELELEEIEGVAVDASGRLWVYWGEEGVLSAFSGAESNHWEPALTKDLEIESRFECRARSGFAVAPSAEAFYVAHERENGLEECAEEESSPSLVAKFGDTGQLLARGLDDQPTSGVASEAPGGTVYADNGAGIAAFAADGAYIDSFGEGQLSAAGALAVDGATGQVFATEPASGKVQIFSGEAPGAPRVDGTYAQNLTPASADLYAQVDPHGLQSEYEFQYGHSSCTGEPSACSEHVVGKIGAGYGDSLVKVELTGLEANTTYYYRVLARNADGAVQGEQATQTFFTTLPSAQATLADDREWELVSPVEKHGALVEPISREGALIQASADGSSITWTASGPVGEEAQGNRRPEPEQVISTRGSQEWSSQDITTPHNRGEGIDTGEATEYRYFTPDLAQAIVQPLIPTEPLENPPLATGASEKTIYLRENQTGQYTPLVTANEDTAHNAYGGKLEFEGANPETTAAVLGAEVPLLAGAGESGLYEWKAPSGTNGGPGQGEGTLALVSVLPGAGSVPASEPALGFAGSDVRNAISDNGARVFWTNAGELGPLYMRDTTTEETVQVNAVQGEGVSEPDQDEIEEGLDEAYFQAAPADGSKVFFTDSWPLTNRSALEPLASEEVIEELPGKQRGLGRPVDLYEYDTETGKLTDLTVDRNAGEQAEVLGTIPGISEDGQYVYFVANGALSAGAERGDCPRTRPILAHPEDRCNLYVSEPDPEHAGQRRTRLIARLSEADAADWELGISPPGSLGGLTAQVSANGRYLAFMSQEPLTGYDNLDANPAAGGARDEEVFLYDAQSGRLACASCNPSGAPPQGVFDTEQAGEGYGLVADRPQTWNGHWLAGSLPGWTLYELNTPRSEHQSRYLSNDGRLFFNSADPLSSQVTAPTRQETVDGHSTEVGVENVYEYEPDGLGTCTGQPGCVSLISAGTSPQESAFLDASEGGNDAFFLTAAQLVAQDTDNSLDVYDARVCGTAESGPCLPVKAPPPPSCGGEECRPAAPQQPSFGPAPTSTYSGPGNTAKQQVSSSKATVSKPKTLTRAEKLAVALKACRKLRRKARRQACERQARKAYAVRKKPSGHLKKHKAATPSRARTGSRPAGRGSG
jgi:DNA-binding beta-propeller fold protein YncE